MARTTRTKEVTIQSEASLSSVAKNLGMTLTDLLELNPGITRLPYVPAGTVVVARA